jgi:hypothetical protein
MFEKASAREPRYLAMAVEQEGARAGLANVPRHYTRQLPLRHLCSGRCGA